MEICCAYLLNRYWSKFTCLRFCGVSFDSNCIIHMYIKYDTFYFKIKGFFLSLIFLLATGSKVVVKRTRRVSSSSELRNEEAVRMSMFPAAKPPQPNEITKIEREDWPGPPCPAAILPELCESN